MAILALYTIFLSSLLNFEGEDRGEKNKDWG